jgi:hypothetical protein
LPDKGREPNGSVVMVIPTAAGQALPDAQPDNNTANTSLATG